MINPLKNHPKLVDGLLKAGLALSVACLIAAVSPINVFAAQNAEVQMTETQFASVTVSNDGREVTVTAVPQKVLTLGPNTTELMVALGLGDKVIGRSLVNHSRGPLPEWKEAVEAIPQLNYGSATREAVLTSGADFIYTVDWEISDQGVDIDEVKKYGMNVYVNKATTLEEAYQEVEDIGRLFNVSEKAEAFVADQKARIKRVVDRVAGSAPKKVLVFDSGARGVFTATGPNFETQLIELAGGKNIFGHLTGKAWTTVSYEDVMAADPDVIVIHDYDQPSVETKIREIESHPLLSLLPAVQEKRYVTITLESVLPGSRMAYAVERLAEAFWPEKFAN